MTIVDSDKQNTCSDQHKIVISLLVLQVASSMASVRRCLCGGHSGRELQRSRLLHPAAVPHASRGRHSDRRLQMEDDEIHGHRDVGSVLRVCCTECVAGGGPDQMFCLNPERTGLLYQENSQQVLGLLLMNMFVTTTIILNDFYEIAKFVFVQNM